MTHSGNTHKGRKLTAGERQLISNMPEVASDLNHCVVEDMKDGGMGSIRFLTNRRTDGRLGKAIAEATYTDEDGVIVSITLNVDTSGLLYELDFWKTDFSRLRRYPTCADLTQQK